jgi:hypothetical protein
MLGRNRCRAVHEPAEAWLQQGPAAFGTTAFPRPAPPTPLPAGGLSTCSVVLRPTQPGCTSSYLNLAEVQLYGSSGAAIATGSLNISATSEFDDSLNAYPPRLAFDGNNSTSFSTYDSGVPARLRAAHAALAAPALTPEARRLQLSDWIWSRCCGWATPAPTDPPHCPGW